MYTGPTLLVSNGPCQLYDFEAGKQQMLHPAELDVIIRSAPGNNYPLMVSHCLELKPRVSYLLSLKPNLGVWVVSLKKTATIATTWQEEHIKISLKVKHT